MNAPAERRYLVLGYGNPGRGDDGLGPALASAIAARNVPGVTVEARYQLNIEDAVTVAEHAGTLFVDARVNGNAPFDLHPVAAAPGVSFSSHSIGPESVLAICETHFHAAPEARVLGIRGYDFELGEQLSPRARTNLENALEAACALLDQWRMDTMGDLHKKTILAIDDDADVRAALRVMLQAEGFTVGEASNIEDGLRVARGIQPDAVIVDLMMESVDAGQRVAQELRRTGYDRPIYLLSSAGDTVRYNIDARALGLSGIFQKPIDARQLVDTLRANLARK